MRHPALPELLEFPDWVAGSDLMFADAAGWARPIRFARGTGGHAAALAVADQAHRHRVRRLVFAHIGRPTIAAIDAGKAPPFGEFGSDGASCSSREHAAIVPRYLGLRLVIAKSYARIHWQNLVNFGVLPLEFTDPADYQHIHQGDQLTVDNIPDALAGGGQITVHNTSTGHNCQAGHRLSPRQVKIVLAGGQIPLLAR